MALTFKHVAALKPAEYEDAYPIPERNLIAEVMIRAIRDILNTTVDDDAIKWRRSAHGWLLDDTTPETSPFSFKWVCSELSLSHIVMRTRILEMEKQGEKFPLF